jgi:class 3 adenylate cyclase
MGHVISDHCGVIERFSGDAMMIFLNDPVPVPKHAEQAVWMAIGMRNRIRQLQHEWGKRAIELGARIVTGLTELHRS